MSEDAATEALNVTVYEGAGAERRPALTVRVSVCQLESYLRRTGWHEAPKRIAGRRWWHRSDVIVNLELLVHRATRRDMLIAMAVCSVAGVEGRRPADVLADVANEAVPMPASEEPAQ